MFIQENEDKKDVLVSWKLMFASFFLTQMDFSFKYLTSMNCILY